MISMRPAGFEPATSRLSTVRCCRLSYRRKKGWEGRDRTYNLRFQRPPRRQLRHSPTDEGERPDLNRRHPDSQTGASTDWATLTMLPPRFELGSRADPALAGYKPAALPVKLRERISTARVSERLIPQRMLPPGLEPGPCADLALTHYLRAALPD